MGAELNPMILPPPPSSRTKLRFVLTRQADRRSAESGEGSGWGETGAETPRTEKPPAIRHGGFFFG